MLLPATPGDREPPQRPPLALLPPGRADHQPGRGTLIDDAALLEALDSGHVAHATLDVFREEPLPPGHPFWAHPRSPSPRTSPPRPAPRPPPPPSPENIRRGEAGFDFLHVVNRAEGY